MSEQLIADFYQALDVRDGEAVAACYHDDIQFNDPAFGDLQGERAKAMWKMLCRNAKDLQVEVSNIQVSGNRGTADWQATYTFSKTGRKVVNKVSAEFEFRDGKIIRHTDHFNLRKWAGQAMGLTGSLLGATGFFRNKFQAQTSDMLDKFQKTHA